MVMIYRDTKKCGRKSLHDTLYNSHIWNISNEVYFLAYTFLKTFRI